MKFRNPTLKPLNALLTLLGMIAQVSYFSYAMASEDWDVYIVPLQNRTPEDMISSLSGLFSGKARFSYMNGKLLASSNEATHTAILKVVAQLDHRLKQVKIDLISASNEEANALNRAFSIHAKNKTGEVHVGADKPSQGGIGVALGDKVRARVSLEEENRILQGKDKRSIVLIEGSTGELSFGSGVNRMTVTPRILGSNQVELSISETKSQGSDTKSIQTTRSGSLDQWLDIGGITSSGDSSTSTIGSKETGDTKKDTHYWIRAHELENP